MPYIYQTTFDIQNDDIDQLQIGCSLQLSLAYLKAFLANEAGFINARAMFSLTHNNDVTHLVFESTWEDWASLRIHEDRSPYSEAKMLSRFEMKITPMNVATHVYEEVA